MRRQRLPRRLAGRDVSRILPGKQAAAAGRLTESGERRPNPLYSTPPESDGSGRKRLLLQHRLERQPSFLVVLTLHSLQSFGPDFARTGARTRQTPAEQQSGVLVLGLALQSGSKKLRRFIPRASFPMGVPSVEMQIRILSAHLHRPLQGSGRGRVSGAELRDSKIIENFSERGLLRKFGKAVCRPCIV